MSEIREPRENPPIVTVSIPTKEEISSMYLRMYGKGVAYALSPKEFRLLRCGAKEVLFYVGYDQGQTLILKKDGEERKMGETTALYQEVKKIIEEHVRTETLPMYTYQLMTENPAMLAWARTKGRELFAWDQEIPFEEKEGAATAFLKSFYPKKSF